MKGLYLAGAGDAGAGARTLGSFQAQATAKNGLANAASSISGTASSSGSAHGHTVVGRLGASAIGSFGRVAASDNSGSDYNFNTDNSGAHSHSVSGTADAQTITGDSETRPVTAPITYIIKLYDDVLDSVTVGVEEASATKAGVVGVGTQEFSGDKTFKDSVEIFNGTLSNPVGTSLHEEGTQATITEDGSTFNMLGPVTLTEGTWMVSSGAVFAASTGTVTGWRASIGDSSSDVSGGGYARHYDRKVQLWLYKFEWSLCGFHEHSIFDIPCGCA